MLNIVRTFASSESIILLRERPHMICVMSNLEQVATRTSALQHKYNKNILLLERELQRKRARKLIKIIWKL